MKRIVAMIVLFAILSAAVFAVATVPAKAEFDDSYMAFNLLDAQSATFEGGLGKWTPGGATPVIAKGKGIGNEFILRVVRATPPCARNLAGGYHFFMDFPTPGNVRRREFLPVQSFASLPGQSPVFLDFGLTPVRFLPGVMPQPGNPPDHDQGDHGCADSDPLQEFHAFSFLEDADQRLIIPLSPVKGRGRGVMGRLPIP